MEDYTRKWVKGRKRNGEKRRRKEVGKKRGKKASNQTNLS